MDTAYIGFIPRLVSLNFLTKEIDVTKNQINGIYSCHVQKVA